MRNETHLLNFLNADLIEAGCDEAGRGPLAGPVFAAAVIMPKDFYHPLLNDSKKMTEKARDAYRSCEDPRKKFRFPPMVYRLIAKERARQGDLLSVETEISLLAGTDILFRERMGQIFCESEQILLSPQDALAQWGGGRSPHRIPRGEIGGILLWENKMWKRQNGEWILFEENEKRKKSTKKQKNIGNLL